MKAWPLERLEGSLCLKDVPVPEPRYGSVVARVESSSLMSSLAAMQWVSFMLCLIRKE